MSYTPPVGDVIPFDFTEVYTPQSGDELDFDFSGIGTTNINCVEAPLIVEATVSTPGIVTMIPIVALGVSSTIESNLLWYTGLAPIESASSVYTPELIFNLKVPGLWSLNTITGTTQQRVKLSELYTKGSLKIIGVTPVPEGVTVISSWPFEINCSTKKPDLFPTLETPPLIVDNSLSEPFIVAGETSILFAPPLTVSNDVNGVLGHHLRVVPLMSSPALDILAIKTMPVGDLYLEMLPFTVQEDLRVPGIQNGFLMEPLACGNALSVDSIFSGTNIDAPPMEISDVLLSKVNINVSSPPLGIATDLFSDLSINVSCLGFEIGASFSDVSIYDGEYVAFPPFVGGSKIESGISSVLNITPLISVSSLNIPGVSRFVNIPPLITSYGFGVSDIKIFNLDFATQFYYFKLTDPTGIIGDIWIPISSFQSRRRNGAPSYLQVVVPGYDYVPDIEARTDGNLEVYLTYKLEDKIVRQTKIIDANMDEIRIDEGSSSRSVTLTGYKTETFISKLVEMEGATYRATTSGKLRYRIAKPSLDLNPGDTVSIDEDTFTADVVSYYFGAKRNGMNQNMEVAEA